MMSSHIRLWLLFSISIVMLFLLFLGSVVLGYQSITILDVYQSFTNFTNSTEHLVIQSVRIPRAVIALFVGAALAVSGVLMQTLTKNPLSAPEILGVNAGAGLGVVLAVSVFSFTSLQTFVWFAFLGAAIAMMTVFGLGALDGKGLTPMQLVLAGAAMSALFGSMTQGLLVLNESALEQVLFWLAGSVSGRSLDLLWAVLPYMIVGFGIMLFLASSFNVLAMGDDVATGLGLKTTFMKVMIGLIVILLAGGAVSVAGPIGFIGIVIPNMVRKLVGTDHRVVLPFSAILGANLLLLSDIVSRYVIMPQEIPVGVMTALIGTPVFIYIARKGVRSS
ncbi:FecCD family ABC transporter permease [Mangrovibacillus cuniculi]|uniref:Iron ABC transporter permease n=1 Tax=Mangrovibacillus cuniculi TaxID=2593652 RepID=A0A7S8CCG5_9BACI|nr:iron ABC transporter permease [Mangrovibacillus cuniculi]QPC47418.1 iron ABC transporter permease [Mangrovibacillus cuniculi]